MTNSDSSVRQGIPVPSVLLSNEQQRAVMQDLQNAALELGFSAVGVSDVDLRHVEADFAKWLADGMHGDMAFMDKHGHKRTRPDELVPGTVRVISLRMPYKYGDGEENWQEVEWDRLKRPQEAIVSTYARGRDYHKVLRKRLQQVATTMRSSVQRVDNKAEVAFRVFTDSAPVMEVDIAEKAGIGWKGKHTLALHRDAGSMFFLGEIYTNVLLPLSEQDTPHCGSCTACMDICPTQAIVEPYVVDARRCISYLTIEHQGSIPEDLRPLMGNRIYGCDDCQLVCPWNKFATSTTVNDFAPRKVMYDRTLVEYLLWDEATFLHITEGSAVRRIGHERWQRNVAIGLGNALRANALHGERVLADSDCTAILDALQTVLLRPKTTAMVAEHLRWAMAQPDTENC